jgi:hypothetical protein
MGLARGHEAVENRGAAAPGIAPTERPVVPAGDDLSEGALGDIVVDHQIAVHGIARERRPLRPRLADGLADRAVRQDDVGLCIQPLPEARQHRRGLLGPPRAPVSALPPLTSRSTA